MSFKRILLLVCLLMSVLSYAGNNFAIKTIVIDAGHGGKDPGAIGANKTNEKDIALAVALKLGDYIQKNFPDVNVIYTRKTDVFLELHERAEIAIKNKADLFIAIHCNSSPSASTYGTSTYVLGLHRTEANLEVAKRENSVILLEEDRDKHYEFDPNSPEGHIIMSMKQNAFLDQSIDIASKIENQYETGAKRKSLGVKQAGFYVLYKTTMPSLLSEIGFISNTDEERFLNSAKGQDQIASSLFKAFKDYKMEMENIDGERAEKEEQTKGAGTPDTKAETRQEPKQENKEVKAELKKEPQATKTEPKEEPKKEVKTEPSPPAATAPKENSDYVVTKSGVKIRKPIENNNGGGKALNNLKEQKQPKSEVHADESEEASKPNVSEPEPKKEPAPKPTEAKAEPTKEVVESTAEKKSEPAPEKKPEPKKEEKKPADAELKRNHVAHDDLKTEETPETKKDQAEVKKEEPKPAAKKEEVKSEEAKPKKPEPAPKKEEVKREESPVKKPEPKPVAKTSTPGEVVFRIQLCALKGDFKNSEKMGKLLGDITNEELPNGFVRYYAGNAKTYAEAKKQLEIAATNGYKDAFIVGFKNGTRMSGEQMKAYQK